MGKRSVSIRKHIVSEKKRGTSPAGSSAIDFALLASRIAEKRQREGLGLREAAERCGGISFSTLRRLERGAAKPDLQTLRRVLAWLDIDPSSVFRGGEPIRAHLRAQRHLESPVASALADVVKVVQEHYARPDPNHEGDLPARVAEGQPYQRLRAALRERLAERFREAISCPLDAPLDPFSLQIEGVEVKRLNEAAGIPTETMCVLAGTHARTWSAATLPLNNAESSWLILLNHTHTPERQRATLMEEICHVLLGHHLTVISHVEGQTFRNYNRDQEIDAYALGAATLVPKPEVLSRVKNGESAEAIAKHFGVSDELIQYRIKVTGGWYEYKLRQHLKPPLPAP
jgi:transcriptional regulator with XRE-family HTH domain